MGSWYSQEVLAWTGHDGPGRPPRGASPLLLGAVAAGLGVVYLGLLFTDTLCPEHRAWVEGVAGVSVVLAGSAVVGLLRGWASGPLLAVGATLGGVAIGVLDAVHDPTRGRVIALLFAALAVASLALGASNVRLRRWQRTALRPATGAVMASVVAAGPQPRVDQVPDQAQGQEHSELSSTVPSGP